VCVDCMRLDATGAVGADRTPSPCCRCCHRCWCVPAEGHVFAVRKLLETPNYGCKAVNLGERASLAQAGTQLHLVASQAEFVSLFAHLVVVHALQVSCGACQRRLPTAQHPNVSTSRRQPISSYLLGWLVSLSPPSLCVQAPARAHLCLRW
jgi:hypothetical protein